MPDYFIGVDSGTQSTKAIVMDNETGVILGKASRSYDLIQGLPPGHMEQNPETWIYATFESVREALKLSKVNPKSIRGIGVSGQQHGFVPMDERGKVIRPAKLWNDTSTAEECKLIMDAVGGVEETIRHVGNPMIPGYTAPKILWLKRHEPEKYARLSTVLLPHDYINYMLTDVASMEYGDASGTILMDVKTRQWCKPLIETIDPSLVDKLPVLHSSDKPVGCLSEKAANRLGLSTDVLVSAGGGDNMMGAIGTGNTSLGKVTVSLGTSGTVYAYSEKPVVDPVGEVAAFCDSTNHWLPMVCTMNVTVATELVRKLFKQSYEQLEENLIKAPAGCDGLLFLPYLTGERTPSMPDSSGVFHGLTPSNFNEANITRATVEGVTLGLNYGLNRMRELGINPTEIRLTGGGSRNRVWMQICADIFGSEVVGFKETEGAALGAAIQAYWCHGHFVGSGEGISGITDRLVAVDESTRVKPSPEKVEKYRGIQRYQDTVRDQLFRSK
ncbi:xylulokinase [Candidatus Bathyarchaeota archaeon]|nr:xylulokinase [Candidatus Bathyarchaeota archaeon]